METHDLVMESKRVACSCGVEFIGPADNTAKGMAWAAHVQELTEQGYIYGQESKAR